MRKLVALIVPLLVLGLASAARADIGESQGEVEGSDEIEESRGEFDEREVNMAASVMGVSATQAAEDLRVQYDAHQTINDMIEAGDHVWFDNDDATIHVYGHEYTGAIPTSVASHIVHDSTLRVFPASKVVMQADKTCGPTGSEDDYCTPLHPAVKIFHESGEITWGCTAGFMVRDYSNNPYMLTAGHCAIDGFTFFTNPVYTWSWKKEQKYAVCEPGPWIKGESPWAHHDAAIFPVTGCGGVTPYIHNFSTGKDIHQEGATNTQYVGNTYATTASPVLSSVACRGRWTCPPERKPNTPERM